MNSDLIRIYRKLEFWKELLNKDLPANFKDEISKHLTELDSIVTKSWDSNEFSSETIEKIIELEQQLNSLSEDSRRTTWT